MKYLAALLCIGLVRSSFAADSNYTVNNKYFPKDFFFGYASAAYQVEGAWDEDGKGENVWDYDAHYHPERFPPNQTGDIAADCYHKTDEDVGLLTTVGVQAYRFSIAWSRVLPNGTIDNINQKGLDYYRDLIKKLRAANIEPLVTMHHWDLPTALENKGGFLNSSLADWFVDYATLLFKEFGNDVKYWATFNEPKQTCDGGYGSGGIAPQHLSPGIGNYICAHNVLRAHAKAYRVYDEQFRSTQNGLVSMVVDTAWFEPASNKTADIEAAERNLQFTYGWYFGPIVYGDYPDIMKTRIAARSEQEGFNVSRLPEFTDEEKQQLKGSYDYLTINMYTSNLVADTEEPAIGEPSYGNDIGVYAYQPDDWEKTITDWFKVVPWGANHLVKWIKERFGDEKGIIVTENGYHDDGNNLEDLDTRGRYHKMYLSNIRDAMVDGVNVTGYMAWSLLNDVEWYAGWRVNLGHYHVDFDSANRTRTPKQSSVYYHQVVTTKCLVDTCVE